MAGGLAPGARRQPGRGFPAPLALVALALFGFFVAASAWPALSTSWHRLDVALLARGETDQSARQRCLGARYVAAVEVIRQALPLDEPYLLVEGGNPLHGGALWVRYELAPRRAAFFGKLADLSRQPERLRRRLPGRMRWVVVAYGPGSPPLLLPRFRFMQWMERRPGKLLITDLPEDLSDW